MKKTKPLSIVPTYVGDDYRISLMRALNSYNFTGFDIGDGEKALQAFSKSNNLHVGHKIKLSGSVNGALTFGKLADLMNRQTFVLNERDQARLVQWIYALEPTGVEQEEDIVPESKVVRTSIQDAIENKARLFIGEVLEGVLDDGTFVTFSMGDKLRADQVGQPQCKFIVSWVSKKIIEMIDVAQSEDKEVRAAYKDVNVKKLIKVLAEWKQQVEQYANFKKANRKQVVRKPKTAAVQVKAIKYMTENKELGIKSIRPAEMIGKEQVWIYNTKYRKLTVFRASSRAGIQAKGSAIQNWDPETSETRTLRKPEETIKRVMDGGKLVLRKVMEELTTAKQDANGRFNEHTLIIKVL